nr:T9SS type A sorting domain-containing protein [Bacteroidales bacterium]
ASYRVGYYIAKDPIIQTSDYCIGSKTILFHNVDTVLTVNDTIMIPSLEISGSYYLIVKIDALDEIIEINEENNMEVIEVVINPKPVSPILVSATPSNESVFLTWEMPEQSPVNGYVIYYGVDSLSVLHKAYTLSTAKEYLITGLNNGTTYFFAVSSYKYLAHESVLSSFVEATPVEGLSYMLPLEGFISENADICFAAEKNILVTDLTIESNSFTKFVAGESIVIRPQTIINAGANFRAYIDTTGTYCHHEGPSNILALGGVVSAGVDTCLAAKNRILVSDLSIESNSFTNLVAGESIIIHPRTSISDGADFRAYIDTTGTYCQHEGPSNIIILDGVVSAIADTCLAAKKRIMVSDLIIESNAVIKLVAGELVVIHPHTRINSGADFRAYIDTTGTYCHQPESMMVVFDDSEEITDQKSIFHKEKSNQFFSLFPNPTAGTFTLQLNDAEETTAITVDIYSLIGELIVQTQLAGKQQYEFDLRGRPDGVYLIRVLRGKEVGVDKLIKQ